jgi:hypothetical protein
MSELKVNKITPKTGTSIQLGESGDTITIPCGATLTNNGSATGFGLSFCTTVKTSPFTATAGKGFLINTGSAVTVTLPASPSTGDELIVVDQTGQATTNNITLGRNGSKIKGQCQDGKMTTNRGGLRLVYSGSSQGWITATAGNDETASQFAVASGGTETTSGDYKIHTFNSDATFTVTSANPATTFSYMVIAGGGAGSAGRGSNAGGGGGAGGFREGKCSSDPYTDSPLDAGAGLTLTAGSYPITVGGGGAAQPSSGGRGASGSNSTFSTITSAGGGAGGAGASTPGPKDGANGGSGGGKAGSDVPGSNQVAGTGNTPPVSPPQGQPGGGGTSTPGVSGDKEGFGGGGATEAGQTGEAAAGQSGRGGAGATTSINGTPTERAGGGAGGAGVGGSSATASGGGGTGSFGSCVNNGNAGTANTGGGGGGGANGVPSNGNAGGSGVVIIRYKYQ